MPTFFFKMGDNVDAETIAEFVDASDAVSSALHAMSQLVSARPSLPDDVAVTISDSDKTRVAVINVTFFSGHDQTQPN